MIDIAGILRELRDTPLPTIFVIAGIAFLFLAVGVQIRGPIPEKQQRTAAIIGIFLMVVGLAIFFVPAAHSTADGATATATIAAQQSNTSISQIATDKPSATAPIVPTSATTKPSALPQITPVVHLSRCQWLQQKFPQSQEAIAQKLQIPAARIQLQNESCTNIVTGFVLTLGDELEISVPEGGCIDAPQDAGFTDSTVSDGVGGLRAFAGQVRAVTFTYRPLCEDSPFYQKVFANL